MSKRSHQIEALFQDARRLHDAGRLAEAEPIFRHILAADPDHAESLHRLGLIGLQLGHAAPALNLLDKAIARKRLNAAAHAHRGHALLALGRAEEALAAGRESLRLKRTAEAQQVIGHALSDLGRPNEAVAAYKEAARLQPNLPDLYNALGLALRESFQPQAAITALREALRRGPDDLIAAMNLAGMLKDTGDLAGAETIYRDLLKRHPNDATIHFNLGILLLLAERFEEAWPEWEYRFRGDPLLDTGFQEPVWLGAPLNGRTLLVHTEQGLGDVLQFVRYLRYLPPGDIILQAPRPLAGLLARHFPALRLVAQGDPLPRYDLRVPIMSLPLALGRGGPADARMDAPYLYADPTASAVWRDRLRETPHPRVGLTWAGNPERMRMDRRRSVALATLAPLAAVPGVSWVSLQKGASLAGTPFAGKTFDLTDFDDTAALMDNLDLVIAVDTSTAHLAGALGKPVWILNRFDSCWRWMLERADSPWYPTARLFRQKTFGDWGPVVQDVAEALKAFKP